MPRKSEASKDLEHKDLKEAKGEKSAVLPTWQPEPDQPSSLEKFIRHCRTEKCSDFQAGHCEQHKPKMQCFNFHFEGQRRRSPISADGTLRYWELPCKWLSQPSKCPKGEHCTLAHSKGEISYHPAKYKTRVCNGSDCQKATCCFAHSEKELRCKAAARYSFHAASRGSKDVEETEENEEPPGPPLVDLRTFKVFPCRKSRGVQHDRKLCPFFHNPRDRRRPPGTYSAEPCEECFDSMAEQREGATSSRSSCSRGDSCTFCHNRPELLYHESVFKRRFCATFPKVETCQRGDLCAFAHSREEVRVELLKPEEEKFMVDWISAKEVSDPYLEVPPEVVDFFTCRFKTLWCPYGTQHGWHECLYAHTDQDWRRRPELGYSSEPCPEWAKHVGERLSYDERCPNGLRCRFAHGSKEQLYHPLYYKTMPCTDWASTGSCPRGPQCAFFHRPSEQRQVVLEQKESKMEGSLRVPEVLSVAQLEAALSRGFMSVEGCDPRLEGPLASAAASVDGATTLGMRTSFGSLASLASLASSNSGSPAICPLPLPGSSEPAYVRLSQMAPWPLGSCPEEVAGNYFRL
eukprot:symbB.v1.2.015963.t1/scaffold1205.1/size131557/2